MGKPKPKSISWELPRRSKAPKSYRHTASSFFLGDRPTWLGLLLVVTPRKTNMVHLKMNHWKRRFLFWKPSFSGSILVFGGVIQVFFWNTIWGFPKIVGFPPKSYHFNRVFHERNHAFWGKHPYFWKHPFIAEKTTLKYPHTKVGGR